VGEVGGGGESEVVDMIVRIVEELGGAMVGVLALLLPRSSSRGQESIFKTTSLKSEGGEAGC